MSFVAQCVFCKHKVKAPDEALGASVRCKKCDNSFTLAPIEEAPSEQVLTRFRRHAPAAACSATDVAAPGTGLLTDQGSAPLPSHNRPADHAAAAPEIPDPARTLRRAIHVAGAVALVLGGAGLACASFAAFDGLTVPLSIAGVVVGLAGLTFAWLAMRPALALPAAGAVVSLTVLMVAVFCPHVLGPAFEAARQRPTQDAQQIVAVPLRSSTPQADLARQNGWIDAGKAALKQGAVRVQVVAVSVAVVPFRGARPTFSKEKYLTVRLLIQHAGSGGPIDYAHWAASGSSTGAAPSLTDERGTPLARAVFGATELPVGQITRAQVHPGRFVEDALVFAAADDAAGDLRLRLPASAWNGAGEFRFLIPAAMIQR